jgi:hypothetical protein
MRARNRSSVGKLKSARSQARDLVGSEVPVVSSFAALVLPSNSAVNVVPLPHFVGRLLLTMVVIVSACRTAAASECTMAALRTLLAQAKEQPQFQRSLWQFMDTSLPQAHTTVTRDGDRTDQWLGLQWDASPHGVLLLIDCGGHILDVFGTGAVESIEQRRTVGAAGQTVSVTALTLAHAGYKLEDVDLFGGEGGKIHLLWRHPEHERNFTLPNENGEDRIYTWRFEQAGMLIRVLGRSSTFPPPAQGGNSNGPPLSVKDLPTELYCWSAHLDRYEMCSSVAGNSPTDPMTASAPDIEHPVIETLQSRGAKRPIIISYLNLTKAFGTVSQWALVTAQDKQPPPEEELASAEDHGSITVCFVNVLVADCSASFYPPTTGEWRWFNTPFYVFNSKVVYVGAGAGDGVPALLLQLCGARSGDGNCEQATALYEYDRRGNSFHRVFLNLLEGSNENQAARFVESGPLRGDIIVDYPTFNGSHYWIEVYRPGPSERYVRVLRYRSHTGYGDGNGLAVADSEMPEILRRLGLWRPGGALPPPLFFSGAECPHRVMRKGEEWCS